MGVWSPEISREMIVEFLECLAEGIHIVDEHGITVFYNRAASRMDGMSPEEVLGVHVLEAFPSLTQKTSTLLRVLETGTPIDDQQQTFLNRKGRRVMTVNRTVPLVLNGKVVGAAEISRDVTRMKELSDEVLRLQERMREPAERKRRLRATYTFDDILTRDPVMLREIERAKRAARTDSPVLVIGETGTGKELVVQSIHHASPRAGKPLIAQNCAAIPSSLLEGILFGTTKGAFTGAEDRPGLFELADGGTLFLDEIQAMPVDLQAKLLRMLEEGAVRRVGDTRVRPVDVRVIVATNEDPMVSIREGRLRRDLYYRIHVVGIHLPPLRERPEDIPFLARHFFREIRGRIGAENVTLSPEVLEAFAAYDWPGNVRELKHTVEGALNLVTGGELGLEHLPPHFRERSVEPVIRFPLGKLTLREAVGRLEAAMIREALKETGGNVLKAARLLGIPRQTLQYRLRKQGIEQDDLKGRKR